MSTDFRKHSWIIPVLFGIIPGCATVDQGNAGAAVRRTSNADQVRPCRFVASLQGRALSLDVQAGQIVGDHPERYVVLLPAGGGVPEIYNCEQP